jgi:malate synthase
MEDAATAEICRVQLWQWIHHGARTADGQLITSGRIDMLLFEELEGIRKAVGQVRYANGAFATAARVFGHMINSEELDDFLTLPAYDFLP